MPLIADVPRLDAGREAERCWQEIQTAMRALEGAEATGSKALYRTAVGVVVARVDAFAKAARELAATLEE